MATGVGRAVLLLSLAFFAIAACSSSQDSKHAAVRPAHSSGPSMGAGKSIRSGPLRVVYHLKFTDDSDPSEQTETVLSDGGSKFRMTLTPPGYEEWMIYDGVRAVESQNHGELVYDTAEELAKTGLLPFTSPASFRTFCPEAKPVGRATILGRAANRYSCQDTATGLAAELPVDSDTGLLLKYVAADVTETVTSIDLHAAIPPGSFDLSAYPSPQPALPPCGPATPGVRSVCEPPPSPSASK